MFELNFQAIVFLAITAIAQLKVSRRWAPLPLLLGAAYMTLGQAIDIAGFNFTIIRLLIAVGFLRAIIRRERITGGLNALDKLMILWALWALLSSLFHNNPYEMFVNELGRVYNTCGFYFLIRIFCQSYDDLVRLVRITAVLLTPLAVEMLWEWITGYNLFSVFGGVPQVPAIRSGHFRAQGPFRHAILAGTVGAVCVPLFVGLWHQYRNYAILGIVASSAMIFSCGSSGPILSAMAGFLALFLWRYRHKMRLVRWAAVVGYILLDLVMKAPAYYIIARVDVIGGSTGWHRAALIDSAIRHLNEWWLIGTDYTRNWMVTGVSWSADNTDITNHYLYLGVLGGLPLMILFILILAKAFSFIGKTLAQTDNESFAKRFFIWSFGASLFTNVATMISVAYFDQSFVFLYLVIAAIGSLWSWFNTGTENESKVQFG